MSFPSQLTVWVPAGLSPLSTRLSGFVGSKFTPSRLITIWYTPPTFDLYVKVPPVWKKLVLPAAVPLNPMSLTTDAIGCRGMPSAVRVTFAGGVKKIGYAGGAKMTPPCIDVSCAGVPAFAASAS